MVKRPGWWGSEGNLVCLFCRKLGGGGPGPSEDPGVVCVHVLIYINILDIMKRFLNVSLKYELELLDLLLDTRFRVQIRA